MRGRYSGQISAGAIGSGVPVEEMREIKWRCARAREKPRDLDKAQISMSGRAGARRSGSLSFSAGGRCGGDDAPTGAGRRVRGDAGYSEPWRPKKPHQERLSHLGNDNGCGKGAPAGASSAAAGEDATTPRATLLRAPHTAPASAQLPHAPTTTAAHATAARRAAHATAAAPR